MHVPFDYSTLTLFEVGKDPRGDRTSGTARFLEVPDAVAFSAPTVLLRFWPTAAWLRVLALVGAPGRAVAADTRPRSSSTPSPKPRPYR